MTTPVRFGVLLTRSTYRESLQRLPNRPDYASRTNRPTIKGVGREGLILLAARKGEDRSAARQYRGPGKGLERA